MMDKTPLMNKLSELKKELISISEDKKKTEDLLDDLLSVKGQLDVKETLLDVGEEQKSLEGTSYRISVTDKGVLYHEYGGYSLFVTPNISQIWFPLMDMVANREKYENDEDKDSINKVIMAILYCIAAPRISLLDAEYTVKTANMMIDMISKTYNEMMSKELKEETPFEDAKFVEALSAITSEATKS